MRWHTLDGVDITPGFFCLKNVDSQHAEIPDSLYHEYQFSYLEHVSVKLEDKSSIAISLP